jgi:hypothetical protein
MAFKRAISDIITEAAKFEDDQERVDFLRKNDVAPLRVLLQYALDSRVRWLLPEGEIPYKPNKEYPDLHGMLYSRARTLYLFVENSNAPAMTIEKRVTLWRQLLETVLPEDAEFLERIRNGQVWKTINKKVVNRAFPGLVK